MSLENALLQAEAKAAEEFKRKAKAEATATEAKRKREMDTKAAHQALLKGKLYKPCGCGRSKLQHFLECY